MHVISVSNWKSKTIFVLKEEEKEAVCLFFFFPKRRKRSARFPKSEDKVSAPSSWSDSKWGEEEADEEEEI